MKRIFYLLLSTTTAFFLTGCPKPCINADYVFVVSSQIRPATDSVRIGDTIFIQSTFPVVLPDEQTQKPIDLSNFVIGSNLRIGELVPGHQSGRDAVSDFDYFSENGRIYNATNIPSPEGVQQLEYQKIGDNYVLRVGIIPKNKGIYAFSVGDGAGYQKSRTCFKGSFQITLTETPHNEHFYRQWRPDFELTPWSLARLYCFEVY